MSGNRPAVSILVAEDDPLLRQFLLQKLADQEDFTVVGQVGSGRETLAAVTRLRPRVLVLDLSLPELTGFQVLDRLLEEEAEAPSVLVLSGDESEETQLEAARRGAKGFVCKTQAGAVLLEAIRAVANGEVWLSRHLIGQIIADYVPLIRRVREQTRPVNRLTDREREVLVRIGCGKSNSQIAQELLMSVSSVKIHIRSIFRKLEIPNRAGAAALAAKEGLLEPAVAH